MRERALPSPSSHTMADSFCELPGDGCAKFVLKPIQLTPKHDYKIVTVPYQLHLLSTPRLAAIRGYQNEKILMRLL